MEKEIIKSITDTFATNKDCVDGRGSCCCPILPIFIFKNVNCVNIFNGACTTWDPASNCAPSINS